LPAPVVHCPDYLLPLARRLPGVRPRGLGATGPAQAAARLDSGIVLTDGALSGPPPAGWGAVRLGAYPLAVAAHPGVGLNSLSLEQLRRVYLGKVGTWRELGGGDAPIQPLAPPPDSYAARLWRALVMDGAASGQAAATAGGPAALVRALSETPGAVGYLPPGSLPSSLRALAVGGALPRDDGYPLAGRPALWFTPDRRDRAVGLARRWSGRPR
jgi:phosphate transport system substrate-binding protein